MAHVGITCILQVCEFVGTRMIISLSMRAPCMRQNVCVKL